jgi:hypothetical protein
MNEETPLSKPACWTDPEKASDHIKQMFVDIGQRRRIELGQKPAERAVFRKLHGVASGSFEIPTDLPEKYRIGVFQPGKSYKTWTRFSSDTDPTSSDLNSTCGVAMKLFGVEGKKLLGTGGTQDFILQNHPVFFVDNAEEMASFTTAGVIDGNYTPYLRSHPQTSEILDAMAKVEQSVLAAHYWSILPYKLGFDCFVKYKLLPDHHENTGLSDQTNYLADDLARRLRNGPVRLKFILQIRTDADRMPLDKAMTEWPETELIHAGTLMLDQQDIWAEGQSDYGQQLSFNPWHSLPEHEPVGSLSAARKITYAASSETRHLANGISPEEPNVARCPFHHQPTPPSDCIVRAAIYPPIGVCRIGDSPEEFFYGPEVPDPIPRPAGFYRDSEGRLKRQAARFRIYGINAMGDVVKELTADEAEIDWSVHLLNQKSLWYEFQLALDIPEAANVQPSLLRNASVSDRKHLEIDGKKATLSGPGKKAGPFEGQFMEIPVYLGEAFTDEAGRLIVLGGRGRSQSYDGSTAVTFANNETWHDDTSDGPITAKVKYQGTQLAVDEAWVIVAPPDYAPMQKSVRTMWDLMRDVAIQANTLTCPETPSFSREIQPIFERLANLQWVNAGFLAAFGWNAPFDFTSPAWLARLADDSAANRGLRKSLYNQFRNYDFDGKSPKPWPYVYGDAMSVPAAETPRQNMELSATQMKFLKCWAAGNFISDYQPNPPLKTSLEDYPPAEHGDVLTRAAMEFCLADAFHPGCEMTWPMRHATMYSAPFRLLHPTHPEKPEPSYGLQINSGTLGLAIGPISGGQYPGGITRWMAVPWQTDTASCRSGYDKAYDPYVPTFWPARVPNQVMTNAQFETLQNKDSSEAEKANAFSYRPSWNTPLDLTKGYIHQITTMIGHFGEMGVVEQRELSDPGEFPRIVQVADRNEVIKSPTKQKLVGGALHSNLEAVHSEEAITVENLDITKIEKVNRFVR